MNYSNPLFYIVTLAMVEFVAWIYIRRLRASWKRVQLVALFMWAFSLYGSDSNKPDTPDPPEPPVEHPQKRVYRVVTKTVAGKHEFSLIYDPESTGKLVKKIDPEEEE